MTYRQLINDLEQLNIEKEAIILLITEKLNIKKYDLILSLDKEIDSIILDDINQLKQGIPVQYILGYTYFYKSKFKVNKNVLIPRFDTEVLIEETIKIIDKYYNDKNIDIVDIGTGSGCIAISLKQERNNINIDAIDISNDALTVARENAKDNNVNINFINNDLLNNINKKYDIIVSNPPYIDINENIDNLVKNNEPHLALYSPNKGLYHYERILIQSKNNLKENGFIIFEIPSNRDDELIELVNKYYNNNNNINNIVIIKDYNKLSRVLIIRS